MKKGFQKVAALVTFALLLVEGIVGGKTKETPPQVTISVTNATAAVGKTARLTCLVLNPGNHKVAWFHKDRQMLLTIHRAVVTRIHRFSIEHPDDETWTLRIDNVQREDKGQYICQLNSEPIMKQIGILDVIVPPTIVDSLSSPSSLFVHEFGNITLKCHAEGNPKPSISWMREDNKHITISKRNKAQSYDGSELQLEHVTRTDMGAYLCIARNNVPPSVSNRIELYVKFSPSMVVPEQMISLPRGTNATLACETEAYPRAVTFWLFGGSIVMDTNKYTLREEHDGYKTRFWLHVSKVNDNDFGLYQCSSRNSFGENTGNVYLNEDALNKISIIKEEMERENKKPFFETREDPFRTNGDPNTRGSGNFSSNHKRSKNMDLGGHQSSTNIFSIFSGVGTSGLSSLPQLMTLVLLFLFILS